MKKCSKEVISARIGFVLCVALASMFGGVLVALATDMVRFDRPLAVVIGCLIALAVSISLATCLWKRWHGATLTEERPVAEPVVAEPATSSSVEPTPVVDYDNLQPDDLEALERAEKYRKLRLIRLGKECESFNADDEKLKSVMAKQAELIAKGEKAVKWGAPPVRKLSLWGFSLFWW